MSYPPLPFPDYPHFSLPSAFDFQSFTQHFRSLVRTLQTLNVSCMYVENEWTDDIQKNVKRFDELIDAITKKKRAENKDFPEQLNKSSSWKNTNQKWIDVCSSHKDNTKTEMPPEKMTLKPQKQLLIFVQRGLPGLFPHAPRYCSLMIHDEDRNSSTKLQFSTRWRQRASAVSCGLLAKYVPFQEIFFCSSTQNLVSKSSLTLEF